MVVPRSARRLMPREHHVDGYRLREVVVLVAVLTRQVAASNRDDMGHDGVVRVYCPVRSQPQFTQIPRGGADAAAKVKGPVPHQ